MGATQNGVECVELPDGRVVVKKKTTRKHEKERSEDDLKIALKEAAYASTKALAAAEAAVKAAVFAAEAVRRAEEISGYAVRATSPIVTTVGAVRTITQYTDGESTEYEDLRSQASHISSYFQVGPGARTEKTTEKPTGAKPEKTVEKAEKTVDKPIAKKAEKPAERGSEKHIGRKAEKTKTPVASPSTLSTLTTEATGEKTNQSLYTKLPTQ